MQEVKNLKIDAKGRINIGSFIKNFKQKFKISSFSAVIDKKNNNITLIPQIEIPLKRVIDAIPIENSWFYNDEKAKKDIKTGLEQMKNGEVFGYEDFLKEMEDV